MMRFKRTNLGCAIRMALAIGVWVWLGGSALRAATPPFSWVQHVGSANSENPIDIAIDPAGNSYVVGRFSGTSLTLGAFTVTGGGLFVAKYAPDGQVLWANRVGPPDVAASFTGYWIPKVAADPAGNAYLGGTFYDQVDFGVTNFSTGPSGSDLFLAKYDSDGNLLWARRGGTSTGPNYVQLGDLVVDESGSVFVTGNCPGDSLGATNFSTEGAPSIFLAKFDTNGEIAWINGTPNPPIGGFRAPTGMALSGSGDIHVCGQFLSAILPFGAVTLTNTGMHDAFVVKFNPAGEAVWAKQGKGSGVDRPVGLAVDAGGNCYFQGYGPNAISFDDCALPGNDNCFLVKYDPAGNVMWCRTSAVFETHIWLRGAVLGSSADAAGNSYLLGQFQGTAVFGSLTLTNVGGNGTGSGDYFSHFVAKYDSEGCAVWARQFGGVFGGDAEGWSIATDAAGNCSVTAYFDTTNAVFDDLTLTRIGGADDYDLFVARLPADAPRLQMALAGNDVVLSWPTNQPAFALECADVLPTSNGWSVVTNPITTVGIQNFVTNSITVGSRFYRLRSKR